MQGEGKKIIKTTSEGFRTAQFSKGAYSELEPGEANDLEDVINLGVQSVKAAKMRKGKEPFYSPDAQGLEEFTERCEDYFQRINEINRDRETKYCVIPDVEGLAVYLGFTRKTLAKYRERGADWQYTIDLVKEVITSAKKQLAASGKMPVVYCIFDLINNSNYLSTNEFHATNEPFAIVEGAEERQRRLADKYHVSSVPDKLSKRSDVHEPYTDIFE